MSKKEVVKTIINIVLSAITSILAVFGLAGCGHIDFECNGNWCIKKSV